MKTLYDKGSALLSALFIMTLVAIAATAMSTRLQLDIYRTSLLISSDKLFLASQGVTFWAMDNLTQGKIQQLKADKVADFPKQLENMYPPLNIQGAVYDLQARFNLNNLSVLKSSHTFANLINNVFPDLPPPERYQLARQINYWLSAYQPDRGQDQFMSYYLNQNPPYNPAHLPMSSPSELRLIKGVNPKLFLTLLPYIFVLPETTPININTASKPVLKALGNGLDDNKLAELLEARGDGGFNKLDKLATLLEKLAIPAQQVTIESTYFLSVAYVSDSNLKLINYALLKRVKDKKGNMKVSLIRESVNTM